jgi:hypothetical protein
MPRHPDEPGVVRDRFPPDTIPLTVGRFDGWGYSFRCAYGDHYEMYIYWDGSLYMVKLVRPYAEYARGTIHAKHLFRDGKICLRSGTVGLPDFEQAYAKSILWATGYSAFRRSGQFLFPVTTA